MQVQSHASNGGNCIGRQILLKNSKVICLWSLRWNKFNLLLNGWGSIKNAVSSLANKIVLFQFLAHCAQRWKKSIFSCSLKPPEIQLSGKHIDVLLFQKKNKKKLQNLYLFWFYVVLNIVFLKETKIHMENSVIFGRFFLKKTNC